jgi:hypothetical protein
VPEPVTIGVAPATVTVPEQVVVLAGKLLNLLTSLSPSSAMSSRIEPWASVIVAGTPTARTGKTSGCPNGYAVQQIPGRKDDTSYLYLPGFHRLQSVEIPPDRTIGKFPDSTPDPRPIKIRLCP